MAPTIVYVHGNGNKVREQLLKRQWDEALFGTDMETSSRMAYWARLRYPAPLPDPALDDAEELPVSPLEEAAPPAAKPAEAFIAATVLEAREEAALTAPLERADAPEGLPDAKPLEEWLRAMTYTADALAEGESAAPPPASPFEALPFPRPLRTLTFRELVKRTFKDVYAYFFAGLGEPIREVLRSALSGIDGPVVVLGHSLGSIIAYDVLREQRSASLEVPLLVTVGSPLGVTEVQDLVSRPLVVPAEVAAWRNASDARDLVAMDHTIRPEYAPAEKCTDFFVTNDSSNHHGIREYLRSVPIRQTLLQLFRQ